MPRNVHYVLSTHWDREWYQTFQDYRYRLVQLIDHIIAGWEDGRLQGPFQSDGQAILLEDYLEIRPERRDQVTRLLRDGHIVAGPWYVLPDEFLVSGESLIRNLEMGRRLVRSYGVEPSNAGFLCDMFGHNSQMPQIFAGFGIPMGFIWRGNNLVDHRLVIWRGADGTELPSYRFGEVGYCTYSNTVRQVFGGQIPFTTDEIVDRQEAFLINESAKTETGPLLAFDGGDHLEWDPADYAVLARRFGEKPDFNLTHTSLDAYMREMLPFSGQITARLEGELRTPALYASHVESQWLIPGVGSSRVNIKLANAACESLLCQWAEPLTAFAHDALGQEVPQGFLDTAWRWLIQNHPHDSICGCSIDRVHEDMLYRFHQTEQIAERITLETARRMTASVVGEVSEGEVRVGVYNPLPRELDEVMDLDLELPAHWPLFSEMSNLENKVAFRIFDAQGAELPYQRVSQRFKQPRWRFYGTVFADNYQVTVVRVSLLLRLPALGYTTLILRAGESGVPTRHPMAPGLVTGERKMENEFLAVTVEADGTLTVFDKRSQQTYARLLTFEDRADIGDGWNHGPAENDQHYFSPGSRTSIARAVNGRYRASFRIRTVMELPAEFDFDGLSRSEIFSGMVIDNLVTLRAGCDRLEVETTVHNNIKDHRLRVLFPSGTGAENYIADSPFDVVERPVALRSDNHIYREPEIEPKPQQSFSAVFDQARGLAVVSSGLLESAVIDMPERTLALTLFRATGKTVGTNGEPGGQMQGKLRFRYWLVPLAGEADRPRLLGLGQQLAGGLRQVYLEAQSQPFYRQPGSLPAEKALFNLEGPAVLTSLRRTSAGLEARLFNPNTHSVTALLGPAGSSVVSAQLVDFEHHAVGEPLPVAGGTARLDLGPKQICTVVFKF
jgi:hypothetical protein